MHKFIYTLIKPHVSSFCGRGAADEQRHLRPAAMEEVARGDAVIPSRDSLLNNSAALAGG